MTEEIIIDGVDISGCNRLRTFRDWNYSSDKWCGISNDGGCECEHNINCLYKQFKRLEQDSKQLTQWLDEARRNADFWCDKCTSLEQENKKLKKECKKSEKYKSTLEELRNDLRKICKEECGYVQLKFCGDCDCRYGQILNKINEVLNDSN